MWAAANMLKSGPNISDRTKRDHKQLNFFDINIKLAQKCCRASFSSVLGTLTCWFKNGFLKQKFSAIEVTTFFGRYNFGYVAAMKVILFSKYSKFYVDFQKALKFQKILMVLQIIVFEFKPLVSVNYHKNACERSSTC